jgi:hypothetical protein
MRPLIQNEQHLMKPTQKPASSVIVIQQLKYTVVCYSALLMTITALILLLPAITYAEQTVFKRNIANAEQTFSYQWRSQEQEYQLDFAIPLSEFSDMPSTQAAFSNAIMQRHIEVALLKYAKTVDPREGRVQIKRKSQGLEYGVRSSNADQSQSIMTQLKTLSTDARSAYLEQHFYTNYRSPLGIEAIKHDHQKYAQQSSTALIKVVEAIKAQQQNQYDAREFIKIALSWMQSIPYDVLESRASSNGAGFVSPKDLLLQNQGDCDSKATLLAALMRAYSAGVQQKMVLLDNHALLAVAIPAGPTDKTIVDNGIEYVLLEATGPAYFNIGEVSDSTWLSIRNRQYTLDAM